MSQKKAMSAADVMNSIRARFAAQNEYTVLQQVANATGMSCYSWIDAVVISLWPSAGCKRSAYEIKVHRGDWLRERENPEKNQWVREYCHEFSYVAPNGIIKEDELPAGVGLYRANEKTITVVRAPSYRNDAKLDDEFLAALARAMDKEFRRKEAELHKTFKNDNREFRLAAVWQAAAHSFIRLSAQWASDPDPTAPDAVTKALEQLKAAGGGKADQRDRKQIEECCSRFREHIADSMQFFLAFAYYGMLDLGEHQNFILNYYGTYDEKALLSKMEKNKDKMRDAFLELVKANPRE